MLPEGLSIGASVMPDALIIGSMLLILVVVLGLALYGLVALIAKLSGAGSGRQEDRRRCVFCRNMTPIRLDRCDWCGRNLRSALAAELADLEALESQLRRFRRSETLKPAAVTGLLAQVDRYRSRLLKPPPGQPAAGLASPFAAPPVKPAAEEPVTAELVTESSRTKPLQPAARPFGGAASCPTDGRPPPVSPAARPTRPPARLPEPGPRPPPTVKRRPLRCVRPAAPRKSWAEMLAGFMEERNIRWIELIGGLLFVGSSAALVLSLWQKLSGFQYIQFLIFVAATSAVFGVGLYAHHRWKLESTSRGLLVIATLLVPLDFLFMALSSRNNLDLITALAGLSALAVFAWLIGLAGRVLVPGGRSLQAVAVLGGSAGVLVVGWWVLKDSAPSWLVAAGCLPVAFFATAVGGYLYRLREQKDIDASRAAALYTLLGTGAFAMLPALGLLASQAGGIESVRACLALPVALAAAAILACGLTAGRKIAMLAALGLAWPHTLDIIAVAGVNCAALVLTALYYRLPVHHGGAPLDAHTGGELIAFVHFRSLSAESPQVSLPVPTGGLLGANPGVDRLVRYLPPPLGLRGDSFRMGTS